MTRPVTGVLLVPAVGNPYGLLEGGPGGYMPPRAYRSTSQRYAGMWRPCTARGQANMVGKAHGLMLAWDGSVVLHGCDHAFRRCQNYVAGYFVSLANAMVEDAPLRSEYLASARRDSRFRLVLVDAQGREVHRG